MGIKYSQFKQDYNHRIHRAVARSDIKTLKYLLEKSVADIDVIEDGHLPINIALHRRNDAIINLLIDSGKLRTGWETAGKLWVNCGPGNRGSENLGIQKHRLGSTDSY